MYAIASSRGITIRLNSIMQKKKTLAAGIPVPGAKIPKAKKEKQMLEYDSKLIKSKQPFGFD